MAAQNQTLNRFARIIAFAFVVQFSGCAGASPVPDAQAASAVAPPLYPVWRASRTTPGRSMMAVPSPDAGAILIAKGYLLAPYAPFRSELDEFYDPRVLLYDGKDWYPGEIVGADRRLDLVLVEANVPGGPIALDGSSGCGAFIAGLLLRPASSIAFGSIPATSCPGEDGRERVCGDERAAFVRGSGLLGTDGELCGIVTGPLLPLLGGDVVPHDEIRFFIETHFASWGRHAKNKPKL